MTDAVVMNSSRPYMLRAMYQWIVDNDCTPYLLVDAAHDGVEVPAQAIKDGKVVLNLAPQAISGMDMGNDEVVFLTRFSGASMRVRAPVAAVQAVYAQETGQGMMFQDDPAATGDDGSTQHASDQNAPGESGESQSAAPGADEPEKPEKPARGAPHLRVIK